MLEWKTEMAGKDARGTTGAPTPGQLAEHAKEGRKGGGLPPVDSWDPPFCGDMDIRIARDGSWHYMGSPIGRKRLVRLFSTILRRDGDGFHYLVTPVEKVRITVDDAPFVAVEVEASGDGRARELRFRTNVEDWVTAGPDHPIRVETDSATGEPAPYVHVRGGLEALIARPVFYELVEMGEERAGAEATELGVWSGGEFFSLGSLEGQAGR